MGPAELSMVSHMVSGFGPALPGAVLRDVPPIGRLQGVVGIPVVGHSSAAGAEALSLELGTVAGRQDCCGLLA